MRKLALISILTWMPALLWAIEPPYLTIKPKNGDGIMSILRRYDLLSNQCDTKHFYTINKLTPKSHIIIGKTYKLPIYTYEYNGKSIRSSIGDNDWDKAVRIRDFNNNLYHKKVKPSRFNTQKKILWVPHSEIYCDAEEEENITPISPSKYRNFPIFGDKYANTPLVSKKLKGQVYYIVSGHGGPDPGASGKYGKHTLCEDEYAYDVSLRLCRKLIQHGAAAYMITRDPNDGIRSGEILLCDNDEITWKKQKMFRNQKPRLFQRSNAINKLYKRNKSAGIKKQRMVAIHIDSRSKKQRADVFFYYHGGSKAGKKIAKRMLKTFDKKYTKYRKNRGYTGTVRPRDLHMLRETKPTSVYVELGNIKNPNDQKRFTIENNRELLAKWLFEGLTKIRL